MNDFHSLLIVLVIALVTIALRFLPFIVFKKSIPSAVCFLGEVLPYAIMGMLVVYCLKSVSFISGSYGVPEIISVLTIVILHKWKHNTLLSILLGTICYMLLVQFVF